MASDHTPSPPPKTSPRKVVPEELVSEASAPPANVTENENAAPASDPWVESFRCTSCNDCTEKFPSIFGYNEDKQAQVKEGYQGTFEQLVLAAENCPASCIHPGSPKNDLEPNLAELKLRAEKFN